MGNYCGNRVIPANIYNQKIVDFSATYKVYKKEIHYYLTLRSGFKIRHEIIEELTNNTFLKAYFAWDRFDNTYTMRTWLYKIARNVLIDYQRKGQLNIIQLDGIDIESNEPCPEKLLIKKEIAKYYLSKIDTLDIDCKNVAIKYFYEGFTQVQIAEMYGVTERIIVYKCQKIKDNLKIKLQSTLEIV